jgi:hypothetical protein
MRFLGSPDVEDPTSTHTPQRSVGIYVHHVHVVCVVVRKLVKRKYINCSVAKRCSFRPYSVLRRWAIGR